jgi:hypothetical protein
LFAYGVGLSLFSYRSISVAPVRGGHLLLFAALHVRLVVASPEPIDVKMGGGQRMEDETLFSGNPGMGNQTDDAAVQSCGN